MNIHTPIPVQVAAQEQGGDAAADAGAVAIPAVAGRSEGAHECMDQATKAPRLIRVRVRRPMLC